ncbi:hypothetical protein GM418_00140 [Maribellus comscasis]|uniref:Uncharacterized protein n=1 Tax=Maribellus comscasis TaxID=2681766 RepID=A0A6I6JM69_9BACT|nr:hypothetical protein [Maribellus comscasis]QGY42118.1 hypothetical protein GM418_00140 [Maribellus comscasis]
MKIYSPLFIALRIIVYAALVFGMAEGAFFDAGHPLGDSFFGEATFVEITQEVLLFLLFAFFICIGFKWKEIQPVSNLIGLFFLISFIREFNFLSINWAYPALIVFLIFIWLFVRDFKKIKEACIQFFSVPASSWLLSGLLITYVFSRLMGRSKFWRLMYAGEEYRLAKAATEESIELLGDTIMFIGAIEFLLYFISKRKLQSSGSNLPTS